MQVVQLSPHFTLAELTVTGTGIDNEMTPEMRQQGRLTTLAAFLEKVRAALGGNPVLVDSAYRNPEVNAAVGGVTDSAHMEGFAADIRCPGFGSPLMVAERLAAAGRSGAIAFDQLILEPTWVHISRDPRLRGELLTFDGSDYTDGIHGT